MIGTADRHSATAAPPSSPGIEGAGAFMPPALDDGVFGAGGPSADTGGACVPILCAAGYLDLPVDHLITELDEDSRASGGGPIDVLLARIDAVAAIRVAAAGRTDGPMQVAAMRFLRDEHDRIRLAVIGAADGPVIIPR